MQVRHPREAMTEGIKLNMTYLKHEMGIYYFV